MEQAQEKLGHGMSVCRVRRKYCSNLSVRTSLYSVTSH